MYKKISLFALLACVGCADKIGVPTHYEVRLDPSLTPAESELVMRAYEDWHVQTGMVYSTVVSSETCDSLDPNTACIHVRYGTVDEADKNCTPPMPGFTHVGCTHTSMVNGNVWGANVVLSSLGDYTIDYQIALHEAGHSLGLAHPTAADGSPIKNEVMTANLSDGYPDITERDIQQYKHVHQE